jgi:hypothetical protein
MRFAFLVVAASLLIADQAGAQQSNWIADARSGCRVDNPRPQPNETIQWTGSCRNGLAEGQGTLRWFASGQPGTRTEGQWRAGKLNSHAVSVRADGQRFEAEYRDGIINGHGILTMPNGDRLDAEFTGGTAVRGVWSYKNGNRYEGPLRNYKPHGKGLMTQANGVVYRGDFNDGNWDGQAIVNFANGDVYEGAWRGLMPNGRGTLHRQGRANSGIWVEGCLSPANADSGLWATVNKSAADCGFR